MSHLAWHGSWNKIGRAQSGACGNVAWAAYDRTMADAQVLADCQSKLQDVRSRIDRAEDVNGNSLRAVLVSVALLPVLFYWASHKIIPGWCAALAIPAIGLSWWWHGNNRDKWFELIRLRGFRERAVARMENRWQGEGHSGEEYRVAHHVYDADLQILGKGSLFELLCTARTGIGRRRLAEYLLTPAGIAEAMARQEAVQELVPESALRERVALLGKFDFQESSEKVFSEWLGAPAQTVPAWLRWAMVACFVLLAAIGLAAYVTTVPARILAPWVGPILAFRMGIAWYFRSRTNEVKAAANRVGVEIGVLREGMVLIAAQKFRSAKLREIHRRIAEAHAAPLLRRLERWTNALEQCEKPWFDLPSQALNLRTQICFEIEQWKADHGTQLAQWLEAWGEFEALAAISGYAAEHHDDVYPEFAEGDGLFEALGLGHPLIPADTCVRNDVALDAANRFYVVSGSNMAGKSTLLRSIGLAVVLANVGAPVRARALRLSRLELFASLSIVDSILEGKSKFLAEVDRVRRMLEAARSAPVLFLIDEILSGTNSRDRRIASEAVVRGLVGRGAIGALSTHDLALTEIAEMDGLAGSNVHMGARTGEDPMDFDYLLKPGITRETNALAIAEMMGVSMGS